LLRRVELEVEVCVRLELGEWLAEIGWVLSVAGVVSIESQLAHSKTELLEKRTGDRAVSISRKYPNDVMLNVLRYNAL